VDRAAPDFGFPIPLDFVALMANYAGAANVPFTIPWPVAGWRHWAPGTVVLFDPGFIFDWTVFEGSFDPDDPDRVYWLAGCENRTGSDGTLHIAMAGPETGRVFAGYGMYVGREGLVEVAPSLADFLALFRPVEEQVEETGVP
jgi:hypothetical protein